MRFRLETPRLILRAFEERDAASFAAYRSDPEVARYQGWDTPYPLELAREFVSEMSQRQPGLPEKWYQVALELKAGGALIGDVAFQILEDGRQAEIAYTLARACWGQGYASEALARLLDYLFGELDLHRVHANIDPANAASARLLTRAGMRHEGRFMESLWWKGHWADEDWYAILQSEWKEKNEPRITRIGRE